MLQQRITENSKCEISPPFGDLPHLQQNAQSLYELLTEIRPHLKSAFAKILEESKKNLPKTLIKSMNALSDQEIASLIRELSVAVKEKKEKLTDQLSREVPFENIEGLKSYIDSSCSAIRETSFIAKQLYVLESIVHERKIQKLEETLKRHGSSTGSIFDDLTALRSSIASLSKNIFASFKNRDAIRQIRNQCDLLEGIFRSDEWKGKYSKPQLNFSYWNIKESLSTLLRNISQTGLDQYENLQESYQQALSHVAKIPDIESVPWTRAEIVEIVKTVMLPEDFRYFENEFQRYNPEFQGQPKNHYEYLKPRISKFYPEKRDGVRCFFDLTQIEQNEMLLKIQHLYAGFIADEYLSAQNDEHRQEKVKSEACSIPSEDWWIVVLQRMRNEVEHSDLLSSMLAIEKNINDSHRQISSMSFSIDDETFYSSYKYKSSDIKEIKMEDVIQSLRLRNNGYGQVKNDNERTMKVHQAIAILLDKNPRFQIEEAYTRFIESPHRDLSIHSALATPQTFIDWAIRYCYVSHLSNRSDLKNEIAPFDIPLEFAEVLKVDGFCSMTWEQQLALEWQLLLYVKVHGTRLEKSVACKIIEESLLLTLESTKALLILNDVTTLKIGLHKDPSTGSVYLRDNLENDSSLTEMQKKDLAIFIFALSEIEQRYNAITQQTEEQLNLSQEVILFFADQIGIDRIKAKNLALGIAIIKKEIKNDFSHDEIMHIASLLGSPVVIDAISENFIKRQDEHLDRHNQVKSMMEGFRPSFSFFIDILLKEEQAKNWIEHCKRIKEICLTYPSLYSISSNPTHELLCAMNRTSGSFLYIATCIDDITDQELQLYKVRLPDSLKDVSIEVIRQNFNELKELLSKDDYESQLLVMILRNGTWTDWLAANPFEIDALMMSIKHCTSLAGASPRLAHDTLGILTGIIKIGDQTHGLPNKEDLTILNEIVRSSGGRLFDQHFVINLDRRIEAQSTTELYKWFLENRSQNTFDETFTELLQSDPVTASRMLPALRRIPTQLQTPLVMEAVKGYVEELQERAAISLDKGLEVFTNLFGNLTDQETVLKALSILKDTTHAGFSTREGFQNIKALGGLIRDQGEIPTFDSIIQMISYMREFGYAPYPILFESFRKLSSGGSVSADIIGGALKLEGPRDISKLKNRVTQIADILIQDKPIDLSSKLDLEIAGVITRYHMAAFATQVPFEDFLNRFQRNKQDKMIDSLPSSFVRGSFQVKRILASSYEDFNLTLDAQQKVKEYFEDLHWCLSRSGEQVFLQMQGELIHEFQELLVAVEQDISSNDLSKMRGLDIQRNSLLDIIVQIKSAESTQDLIERISHNRLTKKELQIIASRVRKLCFKEALMLQQSEPALLAILSENISYHSLAPLIEFIEHQVMQEFVGQKTSNQDLSRLKAIKKFLQQCISTNIFRDEIERFQLLASSEFETLDAIPHRGLLGEASGQICDACWSRQANLLANYPSIVPIIFSKGQASSDLKLMGATLLVPAVVEETQERVLIVRGLNPLLSYISNVDVESFTEGLLDYISSWAKDAGFTSILVVGDGTGRAQTNRPQISMYLMDIYVRGHHPVKLEQNPALFFNGYDITNICYVARKLSDS